jgi:hypothetical protein
MAVFSEPAALASFSRTVGSPSLLNTLAKGMNHPGRLGD